ncbi:cell division cycle protein 123 [Magnaporthiopsis poae ATCC 64411]|uniref:Cell division cycle protein 123 n=1 Tax=Magnaporthiopsis poae (strain ATCC 64411 / 73-15) TaxID=644358 RepID=A0A0C4DLD6_MAGP6|nr:cell division cycle protein 123 [Magnaporthiopsis poae ATCC 64411]
MPSFENGSAAQVPSGSATAQQPPAQFPPVTRDHILNCSYDAWFPRYRTSCLKSSIIRLSPEFVDYLREDGIILADEEANGREAGGDEESEDEWEPSIATGVFQPQPASDSDSESEDGGQRQARRRPPNLRFPELHQRIKDEIKRLGGQVVPKLNWSSPKDATWIMMDKNTMRCTTPDDVYLLLKSSSFISHDLENTFDGCVPAPNQQQQQQPQARGTLDAPAALGFAPVLVLRPYFKPQTALEFRCFVKQRNLVAISQRDLKHYPFLAGLRESIVNRVRDLFANVLRFTFPDGSFVFDVYIPEGSDGASDGLSRARLIDINPWAPRTDSLLFDWEELLDIQVSRPVLGTRGENDAHNMPPESQSDAGETTDEDDGDDGLEPELRLVDEDDPITSNLLSSQYSAHKLPKDVVDASAAGEGGLRVFADEWKRMVDRSSHARE